MHFKKTLLLISFALFFSPKAFSQYYYGSGPLCFECIPSVEIGGNFSTISGLDGASGKAGFYIGFYNYFEINDNFAFRTGINYTNYGAKLKNAEKDFVIHSPRVPLSLHYKIKERYQVFLGGDVGANIGTSEGIFNDEVFDYEGEELGKIKFVDATVFVGGGIIFANVIDLNLRYNFGATNLNKDDKGKPWRSHLLTLSIAYTFRD